LGIDISYSWSDNGGHGEFAHWSYGHGYSWGHNPAYSDASGYYQARSAAASDPNTTSGDYTTYTTEDMRIASYRPVHQPDDANEVQQITPVPEEPLNPKTEPAKDK